MKSRHLLRERGLHVHVHGMFMINCTGLTMKHRCKITQILLPSHIRVQDRMWFLRLLEVCMKYCFCGIDLQGSPTMLPSTGGHTAGPGGLRKG